MPPKKPIDPDVVDTIWLAGVLSMSGSLLLVKAKQARVVRLTVSSSSHEQAVHKFAEITGTKVFEVKAYQGSKPSMRLSIQGAALHSLMTRVWDYLTTERKRQYAILRREITTTLEGNNPYSEAKKIEEYDDEED